MDIRHLSYFLEVAAQMSFTKAAEKIKISQPSLSKMVKNLEDELGVVLFERTTKQMHLTDTGKVVLTQAQEIMKLVQNLSSELSDVMEIKKGHLSIGLPPVIGSLFFPKLVSDFRLQYPQVEVDLVEQGAKVVERLVEEGSVDAGFSVLPVNEELFEVYPFASHDLKLIIYPEHPLASASQVSLQDLKDEKFIFMRKDFALHDRIYDACIQAGFEPNIIFESSQWDFISEMVANRLGVSIFPEMLCEKLDSEKIRTLSIVAPGIPWNLALIWRKNKYLSYVSKEFIEFFQSTFTNPN